MVVPDLKITILGCSGAGGVPTVSRGWGACDPTNPRNERLRASVLVDQGETRLLIDASPDLRAQCLINNITRLDGVLFTHDHADHTHGLDDLREINRVIHGPLEIWADQDTLTALMSRYAYAFEGIPEGQPIFRPWLSPHLITAPNAFDCAGVTITPFLQDHGFMDTLGFRIGNFAYSTDVKALPDAAKAALQDLDLWIIGALTNNAAHQTHVSLDTALEWIEELKPKRAVITHMGPELDFEAVKAKCPAGVAPAYDGMTLTL